MPDLNEKFNGMKKKYREIFVKSCDAILERIEKIRPKGFEGDIFDKYEDNTVGRKWQKDELSADNRICPQVF